MTPAALVISVAFAAPPAPEGLHVTPHLFSGGATYRAADGLPYVGGKPGQRPRGLGYAEEWMQRTGRDPFRPTALADAFEPDWPRGVPFFGGCGCGRGVTPHHDQPDTKPPVAAIPLPAAAWLLLAGLGALIAICRPACTIALQSVCGGSFGNSHPVQAERQAEAAVIKGAGQILNDVEHGPPRVLPAIHNGSSG